MGTIKQICGFKIKIYEGNHPPPHVHIRAPSFDCLVDLDTLRTLARGEKSCDAQAAVNWISDNQTELLKIWERING
ncbi:MAG: DUF4160 domain-containing protein [Magnetococcales bacterium]|nr:DUF4160 domain-containing protein [Magnetococcales bacterium]